ncbi:unnamed protein product, partial [marine sediment metagenome]
SRVWACMLQLIVFFQHHLRKYKYKVNRRRFMKIADEVYDGYKKIYDEYGKK